MCNIKNQSPGKEIFPLPVFHGSSLSNMLDFDLFPLPVFRGGKNMPSHCSSKTRNVKKKRLTCDCEATDGHDPDLV